MGTKKAASIDMLKPGFSHEEEQEVKSAEETLQAEEPGESFSEKFPGFDPKLDPDYEEPPLRMGDIPPGIMTVKRATTMHFMGDEYRAVNPGAKIRVNEDFSIDMISHNGWQVYHAHKHHCDGVLVQSDVDEGDRFINIALPAWEGTPEMTYRPDAAHPGSLNMQFEYAGQLVQNPSHHFAFKELFPVFLTEFVNHAYTHPLQVIADLAYSIPITESYTRDIFDANDAIEVDWKGFKTVIDYRRQGHSYKDLDPNDFGFEYAQTKLDELKITLEMPR